MTLATFRKFDAARQIVYAEVYAPMQIDSQGDFMTGDDIESIAHDFMGSGKVRNIDTNHDGVPNGSYAVESFVAKDDDKTFVPGSWVLGVKVPSQGLWQQIEQGIYKAFSMEGRGRREPTVLKGKQANRLTDVEVNSVSIVKRGANGQEYKLMKQDKLADAFEGIAKSMERMGKTLETIAARVDEQDAKIDAISGGVSKGAPVNPNTREIENELRMRSRLEDRLWQVWERPDQYPEGTEAELQARLEKSSDRLYALGHAPERAELDSPQHSAFFQTGGSSRFLQATASSLDAILGVSRTVSKSDEDEINVTNCLVL